MSAAARRGDPVSISPVTFSRSGRNNNCGQRSQNCPAHAYRPGAPLLPWVFAIARHTRVDGFRRRQRIESQEVALEEWREASPQVTSTAGIPNVDLWRLVAELSESEQGVIRMLKISGMSLQEVARSTGSSVGAVKQKAYRAYVKLRAAFQKRGFISEFRIVK